ncbi:hypothetical protein NLG97_g2231 [Lecanicillium saksenae]|uniref:Uncharacterized protein n=1 Tax=Lecanicillium saksenae TaxID=468837 RepID=A0ACC1R1I2_9HYPO|nr:hypothetical protein NLG97_g2231 [Lecanicillium saksenae]
MRVIFFFMSALAAAFPHRGPGGDYNVAGRANGGIDGTHNALASRATQPEQLQTVDNVSHLIASGLSFIRGQTAAINSTLATVANGKITKDEASVQVATAIATVNIKLSDILHDVLAAVSVDVDGANIDKLLGSTEELLSEVLHTVGGAVSSLGLNKILSEGVNDTISVLGDLVKALNTVLGKDLPNLVPSLVKSLSNLVKGLHKGLLSPLLKGLADVLDCLAG